MAARGAVPVDATVRRWRRQGFLRHPACVPVRLREIPRPFVRDVPAGAPTLAGVRFRVSRPVRAGSHVEVAVEVCGETERFRGIVHWVQPAGRAFEVALRLVEAEHAHRARMIEQASHVQAYRRRANRRRLRAIDIEQAAARWIARCARHFAAAWERPATR